MLLFLCLGKSISVHRSHVSTVSVLCADSAVVVLFAGIVSGSEKGHRRISIGRLYGVQRHRSDGLRETLVDGFVQITSERRKFIYVV